MSSEVAQFWSAVRNSLAYWLGGRRAPVSRIEVPTLPDGPWYVRPGHVFRCELGHPICEAIAPIVRHKPYTDKIGHWRQREPKPGEPMPVCAVCGSQVVFWRLNGRINHTGF